MEHTLRKKFVVLSISVVAVVLFVIAAVVNVATFLSIDNRTSVILDVLSENSGQFDDKFDERFDKQWSNDNKPVDKAPDSSTNEQEETRVTEQPLMSSALHFGNARPKLSMETPFSTRFFTLKLDENDAFMDANLNSIRSVDTALAQEYLNRVLERTATRGYLDSFKYAVVRNEAETLVIFVDCSEDFYLLTSSLQSSICICLIALVAIFILLVLISKKAIAPIVESYEKQKQFITNITHELKTPLAIMKANTEVIEFENGETQWSKSTHKQIARLNTLIINLVSLTKLDERKTDFVKTDFAISDAIGEVCAPFSALAQQENKTLELDIIPNLTYCGDEQSVRNLCSILLENAVKYSTAHTVIRLKLCVQKSKLCLTVINSAENLHTQKCDMWFERFYREDSARSGSSNHFGIGLSIAKAIVQKHGGKISAQSVDGKTVCIKVEL